MANYSDTGGKLDSSVSWIPKVFRDFLGLNDEFVRPSYGQQDYSREQMAQSTTGWIPEAVRRWLGLEYTEPTRYGPGDAAPEMGAPAGYRAYGSSSGRPSYRGGGAGGTYRDTGPVSAPAPVRAPASNVEAEYRAARPEGSTTMASTERKSDSWRTEGSDRWKPSSGSGSGSGSSEGPARGDQPARFEGYVMPITEGVRGYIRGALPPQGLEEFTRLLRKTVTDVVEMYGRTLNFETEEFTKWLNSNVRTARVAPPIHRRIPVNIEGSAPAAPPAPSLEKPSAAEQKGGA